MKSVIFYNSLDIFYDPKTKEIPGKELFSAMYDIFSKNITLFDRTGNVQVPIRCSILPHLELPKLEQTLSFDEICDNRSRELLDKANQSNRKIAVMYSGGIDSTLILCSLMKMSKNQDELNNIVVLLSGHSIKENPNFFYDYIIKKLKCIPTHRFPYYLGNDNYIFITGENADQLFGSQVINGFSLFLGKNKQYNHIDDGSMIDFIRYKMLPNKKHMAERLYIEMNKIVSNAPIKLNSMYQYWWWLNFTTKWQSVYTRILPYTLNRASLKLEDNYTTFYCSKEFQLWAMNNSDVNTELTAKISSKFFPKKYIIEYNKDTEYMNKPKVGSLANVVMRKESVYTIDSDMNFNSEFPTDDYFLTDNSFV